MDDREKLIELLNEVGKNALQFPTDNFIKSLADHLLANGVTVQEWIPVTKRLPETDEPVLVTVSGKPRENITLIDAYEIAEYDPEGWILEMWPEWMGAEVTHWMPLPEPPKGR